MLSTCFELHWLAPRPCLQKFVTLLAVEKHGGLKKQHSPIEIRSPLNSLRTYLWSWDYCAFL